VLEHFVSGSVWIQHSIKSKCEENKALERPKSAYCYAAIVSKQVRPFTTLRERVFRSDKPVTLVYPLRSHKGDNGAEPRCRIIATSAVKGLNKCYTKINNIYLDPIVLKINQN
jgi:hypothetical protein